MWRAKGVHLQLQTLQRLVARAKQSRHVGVRDLGRVRVRGQCWCRVRARVRVGIKAGVKGLGSRLGSGLASELGCAPLRRWRAAALRRGSRVGRS
eukprot:scaffold60961_cov21-Phaeocystis_antarctica.AAC.1